MLGNQPQPFPLGTAVLTRQSCSHLQSSALWAGTQAASGTLGSHCTKLCCPLSLFGVCRVGTKAALTSAPDSLKCLRKQPSVFICSSLLFWLHHRTQSLGTWLGHASEWQPLCYATWCGLAVDIPGSGFEAGLCCSLCVPTQVTETLCVSPSLSGKRRRNTSYFRGGRILKINICHMLRIACGTEQTLSNITSFRNCPTLQALNPSLANWSLPWGFLPSNSSVP